MVFNGSKKQSNEVLSYIIHTTATIKTCFNTQTFTSYRTYLAQQIIPEHLQILYSTKFLF